MLMPNPTAIQWSTSATMTLAHVVYQKAAMAPTWNRIMKTAVTQLVVATEYSVRADVAVCVLTALL